MVPLLSQRARSEEPASGVSIDPLQDDVPLTEERGLPPLCSPRSPRETRPKRTRSTKYLLGLTPPDSNPSA